MNDRRDPICGMQGTLERHGRWFCSKRCAADFLKRRASQPAGRAAPSCHPGTASRLRDPWVWVPVSGLVLATIGMRWPAVARVSTVYLGYLRMVFIPLLLGLLLGGVIDQFIPREYIVRLLSGSRKRVIGRATLLGFLASTCSHGCLALTLELYRKGASVPAVISFLLASPWASMSLTFMLVSLFHLKGLLIIVAAIGIAFVTGLVFQRLSARGRIESNPNTVTIEPDFSLRQDVARRWRAYAWTPPQLRSDAAGVVRGMVPLGRMLLGWVQLGLVLSSILGGLVPHELFHRYLGPSPIGLLTTVLAVTVIEVCSEGSAPLAYELYRQTGALGNAFAFLMGGVVTDYTELGALWTTIGPRTVLWLLAVALPMVVIVGLLLNALGVH